MYLMTFEFAIEHIPGGDNELPDASVRSYGNEDFRVDKNVCSAMDFPGRRYADEEVVIAHVDSCTLRDEILLA